MARRLAELAELVGGRVVGDPERVVTGVQALASAGPEELSFLTDPRFRSEAAASRAGALLVGEGLGEGLGRDLLVVGEPQLALIRLVEAFHPRRRPAPGVDPRAAVDPTARVDPAASVGPFAVVGAGSRVEAEAELGPHVVVGRDCRIGRGSRLHPHAVLYDGTELGRRVTVHAGTVLGADGFGYVTRDGVHHKVPQVGRVVVEDDVEIGAVTAVDRATLGETRIGAGSKVDNLVQIGHNVSVGAASILCGQAGIAGSSRLGRGVVLAGQAGVGDHLVVGDGTQVAAASAVLGSVEAGRKVAGIPAVEMGIWRRQVVLAGRLREILRRLTALERRAAAEEE